MRDPKYAQCHFIASEFFVPNLVLLEVLLFDFSLIYFFQEDKSIVNCCYFLVFFLIRIFLSTFSISKYLFLFSFKIKSIFFNCTFPTTV